MAAVTMRTAAWEDRIVVFGKEDKNVVYVKSLNYDPNLVVVGGFIRVRGEKDEDNGPRSDIVEYVQGRFKEEGGLRLKSTEGMKMGDRVWVSLSIK